MNVRNYIHLTGNLGTVPKTGETKNGRPATSFRLATNDYYRDGKGERQQVTDWHNVVAYGKLAELFAEHLDKGSQVSIVGRMRYRRWEDQHQQVRTTAEVVAQEFTFLSAGRKKTEAEETVEADIVNIATGEVTAAAKVRRSRPAPSRKTAASMTGRKVKATAG